MSQLIISFSSSSCSNSFGWVIVCLRSYAFHLRDKRKDLKQQTHTFINHSLLYQIFLCLAISIFRMGFEYRDLIMYFVIRNSNKFYLNVIIVNVENFWEIPDRHKSGLFIVSRTFSRRVVQMEQLKYNDSIYKTSYNDD